MSKPPEQITSVVDVRGRSFRDADPVRDFNLSQSEIVLSLKGEMHMSRPYSLEQLIHDIERLTPAHLDIYANQNNWPFVEVPKREV